MEPKFSPAEIYWYYTTAISAVGEPGSDSAIGKHIRNEVSQAYCEVLSELEHASINIEKNSLHFLVFSELLRNLGPGFQDLSVGISPELIFLTNSAFASAFVASSREPRHFFSSIAPPDEQVTIELLTQPNGIWWTSPPYLNKYDSPEPNRYAYSAFTFELGGKTLTGNEIFVEDSPFTLLERCSIVPDDLHELNTTNLKIFTITCLEDYIDLVNRFPLKYTKADSIISIDVVPDWNAISAEYDGVYLTPSGYLQSAYVPCEVNLGISAITGWSPGVFYRLH